MNNNNNNSSNKVKKKKARAKDIKIDGLLRSQGGVPARIKLGASSSAASKTRIVNPQHIWAHITATLVMCLLWWSLAGPAAEMGVLSYSAKRSKTLTVEVSFSFHYTSSELLYIYFVHYQKHSSEGFKPAHIDQVFFFKCWAFHCTWYCRKTVWWRARILGRVQF